MLALVWIAAQAALAQTEDLEPPAIEHHPCESFSSSVALRVEARISDASPLFEPKVFYRFDEREPWKSCVMTAPPGDATFQCTIGTADLNAARLAYFIQVYDSYGNGPAFAGSKEDPFLVPHADAAICPEPVPVAAKSKSLPAAATAAAPEPACTSLLCSYWFWGGVGAAVLGTGIVVALLVTGGSDDEKGTIVVTGAGPVVPTLRAR